MAVATLAQTIKYCAVNQVLAEITYNGTVRVVEIYSFRPSKDPGNMLLYVHDVGKGKTNSYKVGSIEHIVATAQKYSPKYPVEIT